MPALKGRNFNNPGFNPGMTEPKIHAPQFETLALKKPPSDSPEGGKQEIED